MTQALRARICRALALLALAAMAASGLSLVGAEPFVRLRINERARLESTAHCAFSPAEDGEYVFCAFGEGGVNARLTGGGLDVSGENALSATLAAGVEYSYAAEGASEVEVMRYAHGRCLALPIDLGVESVRYAKTITRAGDAHWFSFVAPESGWYSARSETMGEAALDARGTLMDASGTVIAENDDALAGGEPNFLIRAYLTGGERYFLRITAADGLTGAYRLAVTMPLAEEAEPTALALDAPSARLKIGEARALSASVEPEGAQADIVWASEDASVAVVSPDGKVTAVGAGATRVWALGKLGLGASCEIEVAPIAVAGVVFTKNALEMRAEEETALPVMVLPADASEQALSFASSDEAVLSVSAEGVATGVGVGSAVVTARSLDGGFEATIAVTVFERAGDLRLLAIGEQKYDDGRVRVGAVNTTQGVYDAFLEQRVYGKTYAARLLLDCTREQFVAAARTAFEGAREGDISVLYVNCHGEMESGVAYLALSDGTHINAAQLAALLSDVPGSIVLAIDCCYSGDFIADASLADAKYTLFASASPGQDSYRRSFGDDSSEANMATVFARSLCEGMGWDMIRDKSTILKADANRDLALTCAELADYVSRRVSFYLDGTGVRQEALLFPAGSTLVIAGRAE